LTSIKEPKQNLLGLNAGGEVELAKRTAISDFIGDGPRMSEF